MKRNDFVLNKKIPRLGSSWRLNMIGLGFNKDKLYNDDLPDDITLETRVRHSQFTVSSKGKLSGAIIIISDSDLEIFYEQI